MNYMFALESLIAPYNPDEDTTDEESMGEDDEGVISPAGVALLSKAEQLSKITKVALDVQRKEQDMKSTDQRREEETARQVRKDEWLKQTLINSQTRAEEVEELFNATWEDPRKERRLRETCSALRVAVMSKTLVGNSKDNDGFIKQADAGRNRSEWCLDKRHTYRRMILTDDMPSWMQPVEVMAAHYQPIWYPQELNEDGSPNLA
jgi:hypothetical protein